MRYLCTAVKIFALSIVVVLLVACGDIDQDPHTWDFSGCYEWQTIYDEILEPDRAAIVDIDERKHRVITESDQNAWLHVFDADDNIAHEIFVISDAIAHEPDQTTIAVVPHRKEIEWRLVVDVFNEECRR